jgi:transmembrane sensor
MSERLDDARQLGRRIDAGWQREDIEAQLTRLHARQHRRARRVVALPVTAAAVAAAIVIAVLGRRPAAPPPVRPASVRVADPVVAPAVMPPPRSAEPVATVPPAVALDDSSVVAPPGKDSRLVARPVVRDEPPVVAPPPSLPTSTWRDDAARGDYAAAWAGLAGAQEALDSMPDLLLAGDVARLSGHAASAVASLSRAVVLHPGDPRAPLAAFTLGRVHLEDLGAPRDAALAFARARELAPEGPLAEDALAREVEAWSRAGETETARSQAMIYTRLYPAGRRVHAVRRFGGLELP